MTLRHEGGPVTSVTFRTDGNPVMASANTTGAIAIWDLEGKRLLGQLDQAHSGAVSSIHCLQVLITHFYLTQCSCSKLDIWFEGEQLRVNELDKTTC